MKFSRSKLIWIGLPILLLATCGVNSWYKKWRGIGVQTSEVSLGSITSTISASGKIYPEIENTIKTAYSGTITDIYVKEGQEVKKGDALISISTTSRSGGGLNPLFPSGDEQETTSIKTISSPINGIVNGIKYRKGERVSASSFTESTELMRVANFENFIFKLNVSENDINKINIDDSAQILIDAYPDDVFSGKIVTISNNTSTEINGINNMMAGNNDITTYKVHVLLNKESYKHLFQKYKFPFRSAMNGLAEIIVAKKNNILTVPSSAIIVKNLDSSTTKINRQLNVYTIDNKRVKSLKVKTGIKDYQKIEVEGLTKGTKIITGPSDVLYNLKDGDKVYEQ